MNFTGTANVLAGRNRAALAADLRRRGVNVLEK